jgi:hypothetical protein
MNTFNVTLEEFHAEVFGPTGKAAAPATAKKKTKAKPSTRA